MRLGRLLRAVDAVAPFDLVEVDLEDAGLRPGELEKLGDIGLDALAQEAAARPQQDVLGGLLRDGAGAAQMAARSEAVECRADLLDVEAVMDAEPRVLGGDDRAPARAKSGAGRPSSAGSARLPPRGSASAASPAAQ